MQNSVLLFPAGYNADLVYKFKSNSQAYIDAPTSGLSMTAGQLVHL